MEELLMYLFDLYRRVQQQNDDDLEDTKQSLNTFIVMITRAEIKKEITTNEYKVLHRFYSELAIDIDAWQKKANLRKEFQYANMQAYIDDFCDD